MLESIDLGETLKATLRIRCSKGTYIRTLADDLGRRLGYGAHAESLTRLACGPYQLDQAQELDDLFDLQRSSSSQTAFIDMIEERGMLLPMATALAPYTHAELKQHEALDLIAGRPLFFRSDDRDRTGFFNLPDVQIVAFYCRGQLIAAGHLEPIEAGARRVRTERVLIDLADFR
jgi:tRNA U55 pseudouridine synthase TruB